jgi:hypothetical protein
MWPSKGLARTLLVLANWLFSWGIGMIAILALLKIFLVHA